MNNRVFNPEQIGVEVLVGDAIADLTAERRVELVFGNGFEILEDIKRLKKETVECPQICPQLFF